MVIVRGDGGSMAETTVLELISEITEFNDISEFMQDKDLDKALELLIKLIMKPDVPSTKAPELIITLQALSSKFAIMSRYYTTFEKGTDASKKKNVYYTLNDAINRLVDALKYAAKFGA
ncbi:hypothetical protein UFOVP1491_125 [uncultured Caudovirales phage]|jgi:hypothetical protein|uniref:Uncharacterized protein n=1 Tax=uncultured Caudovirales phage TaxID=2100421 RepID=A0A6J5MKJ9_9CAUD|nr:hypothetical protein UFOVP485_148 [uncultured Caudovirales phage]CAB4151014.1 hypothetical protein UFOVP575_100 [uncultured Caudovirales phage]CAB4174550.1 hypothetical protein UFOVP963_60 [uncultured Caudovirales phage]CAB4179840.1 hypothetical protein UFOVP1032_125 [uncultured Caudovirales phage]CAB4185448.1 hypothetical protein UFOVP1125_41 [uncultured Caudovirales phage]